MGRSLRRHRLWLCCPEIRTGGDESGEYGGSGDRAYYAGVRSSDASRTGLGYELLRRSLVTLAAHGCHKVSLTVTSSNAEAAQLYRRMGFVNRREFAAYVWELR